MRVVTCIDMKLLFGRYWTMTYREVAHRYPAYFMWMIHNGVVSFHIHDPDRMAAYQQTRIYAQVATFREEHPELSDTAIQQHKATLEAAVAPKEPQQLSIF